MIDIYWGGTLKKQKQIDFWLLINFAYCRSDKEGLSLTSSPPVRVKVDTKIRKKIGSGFIVNIKKKKKKTHLHTWTEEWERRKWSAEKSNLTTSVSDQDYIEKKQKKTKKTKKE
jgi:hypothetical protein